MKNTIDKHELTDKQIAACKDIEKAFKKVINGSERLVYPSWHDLPLVKKANRRLIRKYSKYKYQNNNYEF